VPSTLCAIDKGWKLFRAIHQEYYVIQGRAVVKKQKNFLKLSQEEFLDVESVQLSRVLASRRVNFGARKVAWSSRRKEGRSISVITSCALKRRQEMLCTN
jgi:hypothetical protein